MALASMRWPQCLLCEESILLHVDITADATGPGNSLNHRRDNASRRRERAHALDPAEAR